MSCCRRAGLCLCVCVCFSFGALREKEGGHRARVGESGRAREEGRKQKHPGPEETHNSALKPRVGMGGGLIVTNGRCCVFCLQGGVARGGGRVCVREREEVRGRNGRRRGREDPRSGGKHNERKNHRKEKRTRRSWYCFMKTRSTRKRAVKTMPRIPLVSRLGVRCFVLCWFVAGKEERTTGAGVRRGGRCDGGDNSSRENKHDGARGW